MFSIGFSTWIIAFAPTINSDNAGGFTVYDINEYVTCQNGPTVFDYTTIFFKDDDLNTSYEPNDPNRGQITVTYDFNYSDDSTKCPTLKAMRSDGGLKLTFNLWYQYAKPNADNSQPSIFTKSNTAASLSVDGEAATFDAETVSITNNVYTFEKVFKIAQDATPPEKVTVTYTFTTTVGEGFRQNFGKYLLNNFGANGNGEGGITTKFFTSAEAEVVK